MSFGVKNGPPTYQRVVTKTFKEYLKSFLKIFLDDMKIFLNLDKFAFMVFLGMILGFIVSKEGKLPNPKKIQVIINMPPPMNPQQIQVLNGMAQFYICFIKKNCYYYGTYH
jgi:hypothetical protein